MPRGMRSLALVAAAVFALLGSAAPAAQEDFDDLERRAPGYHIRIEGLTETIYEGKILNAGPCNVTTASGGTHPCDGTNGAANPTPGATPTCALNTASMLHNFTFDGVFDTNFDDFNIIRIGPDTQTDTSFWYDLINFQPARAGACEVEIVTGTEVLWAYNANNAMYFLQLLGPRKVVQGQPFNLTVNGWPSSGGTPTPVQGAQVGSQVSDANGIVTFTAPTTLGFIYFKADRSGDIRSNSHRVNVRRHLA